ncbi:hypothetical protein AB0I35_22365 [Nocardia sp. NPDC050378]|uniref:hypothetical protein n=1 Tax=Nocardia sp. NPDC050378 TaxID=3155400 RepID=UPI0033E11684
MSEAAELLEARINELRAAVRRAVSAGDRLAARQLRNELRAVETEWDEAVLGTGETPAPDPNVPVREHVHRALTLLGAPSAPKLVMQVHTAFFSGDLAPARLTSLRRDEERSFRAAPFARPYYICAALTTDLLAPARGLLALSSWALPQRMIGPLSPRVNLLTSAIRLADHVRGQPDISPDGIRLMWRLANSIPGVTGTPDSIDAEDVKSAAQRELAVHEEDDAFQRHQAATRAAQQLDQPAQLFGTRLSLAASRKEMG